MKSQAVRTNPATGEVEHYYVDHGPSGAAPQPLLPIYVLSTVDPTAQTLGNARFQKTGGGRKPRRRAAS